MISAIGQNLKQQAAAQELGACPNPGLSAVRLIWALISSLLQRRLLFGKDWHSLCTRVFCFRQP